MRKQFVMMAAAIMMNFGSNDISLIDNINQPLQLKQFGLSTLLTDNANQASPVKIFQIAGCRWVLIDGDWYWLCD